jgi:hypothetical protein
MADLSDTDITQPQPGGPGSQQIGSEGSELADLVDVYDDEQLSSESAANYVVSD